MTTASAAAGAYASLQRLANPAAARAVGETNGPSFGELLRTAVGNVAEAGRRTDMQTQAMAAGRANVIDVVTAVAETEVTVETLVAVRDRMITAYEEIMRMPI